MIKMIIKMNDDKIEMSNQYTLDKIYAALDRIFSERGMERVDSAAGIEYRGCERSTDFASFGKIMLGLKEQTWFMDNASEWLFCSNDDSDDPGVFNEEDLLVHYGRKAAV